MEKFRNVHMTMASDHELVALIKLYVHLGQQDEPATVSLKALHHCSNINTHTRVISSSTR